jgi:hypothetical protein
MPIEKHQVDAARNALSGFVDAVEALHRRSWATLLDRVQHPCGELRVGE